MPLSPDILRRIAALKLEPDAMAEVLSILADAEQATQAHDVALAERRRKDAKRKRVRRMSADIPRKSADACSNTKKDIGGGGGESACAREAGGLISDAAFALTTDVLVILGIDPEFVPPAWIGAPGWFDAGIRGGWNPAVVRIAAQRVAASRRQRKEGPPWSYKYLEKPIVREHESAASPAPAQPQSSERQFPLMRPIHGVSPGQRPRPKSDITACLDARLAELSAEQGDGGDEGREGPPRLLSHG